MLKVYDGDLMYSWTYKEWRNRIIGAELAVFDAHDLAVQAAWVAGDVARRTSGKAPLPSEYFDVAKAHHAVLTGVYEQKKPDFTIYDRMKDGLKSFDWGKHFVAKESKPKAK